MARYDYTAVVRALAILEALGRRQQPPTLTEVARSLDLSASTVHRLLAVLCDRGFVRRLPVSRRYVLSFQQSHLGPSAAVTKGVARLVQPHLQGIVAKMGETSRLAALEGSDVRYWAEAGVYRPDSRMLGALVDAHASASGKVLLAARPPSEIEQLYRARTIRTYNKRTIGNLGALLAELARVRRQGWAIAEDEMPTLGIRSMAVPCIGPTGEVLFAVSISGPAGKLPASRRSAIVETLKTAAREISASLGLHHSPLVAMADENIAAAPRKPRSGRGPRQPAIAAAR